MGSAKLRDILTNTLLFQKQPGTEGVGRPIQRRSHRDRCGKSTKSYLNTQPYLPQHFLPKNFVHRVKARETRTRWDHLPNQKPCNLYPPRTSYNHGLASCLEHTHKPQLSLYCMSGSVSYRVCAKFTWRRRKTRRPCIRKNPGCHARNVVSTDKCSGQTHHIPFEECISSGKNIGILTYIRYVWHTFPRILLFECTK